MFHTIVVPLDGSAPALQALPIAARIARSSGGPLVLFRAISPSVSNIGLNYSEAIVAEHEKAGDDLEQIATSKELCGLKVLTEVRYGEPAYVLPEIAQQYRASLIVLCRQGAGGRKHWMGSAAWKVACQC